MKNVIVGLAKVVTVIVFYSTVVWLAINPILNYFGANPVDWIQSLSFVTLILASVLLIITSIILIKEL